MLKQRTAKMKNPKPYSAIKVRDHASSGDYSWVVFDMTKTNARGEFTYLADCVNAAGGRRIVRGLNDEYVRPSRRKRKRSRPQSRS